MRPAEKIPVFAHLDRVEALTFLHMGIAEHARQDLALIILTRRRNAIADEAHDLRIAVQFDQALQVVELEQSQMSARSIEVNARPVAKAFILSGDRQMNSQDRRMDIASVGGVIAALYACISGPAGALRDWDRFRYLHRPEALSLRTVVDERGGVQAQVFGVEQYIANVTPFFADNDFFEIDISHRIQRFGQVAHVWSLYEARPAPDSPVLLKRGANSIQLFDDTQRWWIVSTIWDNERAGLAFDLW
jgi:hypothetical protein